MEGYLPDARSGLPGTATRTPIEIELDGLYGLTAGPNIGAGIRARGRRLGDPHRDRRGRRSRCEEADSDCEHEVNQQGWQANYGACREHGKHGRSQGRDGYDGASSNRADG